MRRVNPTRSSPPSPRTTGSFAAKNRA